MKRKTTLEFLQDYSARKKGDIKEYDARFAECLIDLGVAKKHVLGNLPSLKADKIKTVIDKVKQIIPNRTTKEEKATKRTK